LASVLLLATLAALLAVAGAALSTVIRDRAEHREQIHALFERAARVGAAPETARALPQSVALTRITDRMRRAGIEPKQWHAVAVAFGGVLWIGTATLARGVFGAVLGAVLLVAGIVSFLNWRTRKQSEMILEQLPSFLDHVVRAVQTGSSLPNALFTATEETPEPIRGVFARVVRQTRLGVTLDEALDQAASLYSVRELSILSLTVRVSQRYGGSVRDVLGSIVAMIRQRERARREFRAMTGETRLSALILGALPAVIAVYVMIVNPEYLGRMTADPAGRIALYVSGGLQVFGSLVLWRMVKSV
jgi:tight adherence protein B